MYSQVIATWTICFISLHNHMTHDTLLTDYIVTNKTVTDCGLYVYVQHPWEWGRSEDLGSVMWCDGLVEWSGVRVRTSPELVQSWGGRQWNNNMDTEAETPDYKDWGDYGQHWGVDRVKLQFKTGQQRPLSSLRTWSKLSAGLANHRPPIFVNFEFLYLSLWSRLHLVIVFDVHRWPGLYERKIKKILSIFLLFCKCNM